ncbi:PIN domain-containing protein [Fidelibacter multiformis]|uniref:type II toxin-antitoxin system VapC family toxin n=1 Tax=Fidelibacter multiformis TaxID=3377529 RepID=UPI0037DC9B82
MILVDTSVLIDYLKGTENTKTGLFDEILDKSIPWGISALTYVELLQGAKSEREFKYLKEYLISIPLYHLNQDHDSMEKAARFYFRARKAGLTIRSTIDILIAQTAIDHDLYLLHNNSDYDMLASVIHELKIY